MEEIKILCATADEMASISDDEPFGLSDEDHGEAHAFDADWLLEQINRKITAMDVNSLIGSHADTIAGFSEEDQERVDQARRARIDWIIAQSKAAAKK